MLIPWGMTVGLLLINTAAIMWIVWAIHMHNGTFLAIMEWQRLHGKMFDDLAFRIRDPLGWQVQQSAREAMMKLESQMMNGDSK